ncbi:LuxR family transcriptional regulator [Intrasporangium oryzae NRRL B-24470]|uniref:LuxR family transcriptional regulator n=1 Tax=Intrasporangium oryzae NRRL B-24470 TaxID=1386089 RepID=W9GBY2_9MICO|nr:LuxR family transcriptional regulator [Intrasporangium oryzae]EWT02333.1 LuxR family transcriptional regulator [Intrasporangium oryzae NRRL B-24470]
MAQPNSDPDLRSALVGRDHEQDIMRDFVCRLEQTGHSLRLTGEPGIGKTALLEVAARAAARHGHAVLRAGGAEHEADLPYSTLHQLLLPLYDQVEGLPGWERMALRSAIAGSDERSAGPLAIGHATLTALRRHAQTAGLLVIVDDVSWLDRETASVLAFVARRLEGTRMGFLAAGRPERVPVLEFPGTGEVMVQPLADPAARLLLDQHHPQLPPDLRRRVLAEARGNPLALLELPAALQRLQGAPAAAALDNWVPMTRRLQAAFGSGLNTISEQAQRLLLLAALDGTGDLRCLAAAGALQDATGYLSEAERAGLACVDETTHRIAFTHHLTRSAVIAGTRSAERRRAHQDLARRYPHQSERYSWHVAAATVEPDESVAVALEAAAQRSLRRGDSRSTTTMLVRAAQLSPSPRDHGRRMAKATYIGAEVTGELERASGWLANSTVTDPEPDASLRLAASAALILLSGDGDLDVANRLLSTALGTAEGRRGIDPEAHRDALYALQRVCCFGGRGDLWENFFRHLERLSDPPVELVIGSQALADPARLAHSTLRELDGAIAELTTELDPARIVRVSTTGMFVDRSGDCRRPLWRVARDGRAGGAAGSAVTALALLAQDAFRTGDWEAADRLAMESEKLAEACGGYWSVTARQVRAFLAAARGDLDAVGQLTDELRLWAIPRGIGASSWAPRCLAAIGSGDFELAYQEATVPGPAGVLPHCAPYALWMILDLVEAAVRTGRQCEAHQHVRAVEEAGLADLSSRLALLAGAASALTAPDHRCAELFESALTLPEAGRWPFEQARVQLLYGERLRRLHRVRDARAQLASAVSTFRDLGAGPWVSRATAELGATGVAAPGPDPAAPARSLTPQERKVVELAATGLTNKQIGERLFLSARTVGFHLSRAFPKLGVGSRSALRDALSNTRATSAAVPPRYTTPNQLIERSRAGSGSASVM